MKTKTSTILIILAIALAVASVFFLVRKALPSRSLSQAQTMKDWVHASGGTLKVMVSYPEELHSGEKNLITVTYEADPALEAYLEKGYTFDAEFSAPKSVITPQKRMMIPIEKGRQIFIWELEPFAPVGLEATIQMAMGDSNLNGAYAITPQITFNLDFKVAEQKLLSPDNSLKIGLALLASAGLLFGFSFLFKQKEVKTRR